MILPVSEKAVLRLVQSRQATSQIQIARHLGVSANTIHSVVRRLLDQRMLEQSAVSRQQRGRPALHYRMRVPKPVLAVQWLGTEWHAGLIQPDPKRDVVLRWNTPSIPTREAALQTLGEKASALLREAGMKANQLEGCAFSVNAARFKGTGRLTSSVISWIADLDETKIAKAVGCPVWVLSAPGLAEAELSARAQTGCRRLAVFNVGDGVSAHGCGYTSLWADMEVLRGEIGHIVIEPQGRICGCGHRGCLETLLAGSAVQQRVREDVQAGVCSQLGEALKNPPAKFFDLLERLYTTRVDSYAVTTVEEFLDRCAWAISVVVNMYNPEVIVLSGYTLAGRESWRHRIRELAATKILHGEQTSFQLEFARSTPGEHLRRLAETAFLNHIQT